MAMLFLLLYIDVTDPGRYSWSMPDPAWPVPPPSAPATDGSEWARGRYRRHPEIILKMCASCPRRISHGRHWSAVELWCYVFV